MCLSIPGKVEKIEKDKFLIDYGEQGKMQALRSVPEVKVGDWVIVNNKIIVSKLSEQEAKRFFEIVGINGS